ncbi:hypothetical protein Rsub_08565 [Raphidocelis subcapitata]|uniref:SprT-like domain-containing protein n=1 Tax=Raphidocelis subcapitata TaxID=307507 RepID=A0A2V0P6T6_9CHLO|nr:hypothetical protein Rsub_08565 [Raphidocelis subcapitata]|eukprot:GBF95584.1 hypothetical protein Rsub_08565 [Raphidocelis subcapitata]
MQTERWERERAAALAGPPAGVCDAIAFRVAPPYSACLRARTAWARVLRRARHEARLARDFDPAALTDEAVSRLAALVDAELLGGQLRRLAARPDARPLRYAVEDGPPSAGGLSVDTTASYDWDAHCITVHRAAWGRAAPGLVRPMQIDGVHALSRLEWLAHTLGHEMVHAVVENACRSEERLEGATRGAAAAAAGGHGPLFQRLNRHLMGHTAATRYAWAWRREGRRYEAAARAAR